jgi:hypothetical protein
MRGGVSETHAWRRASTPRATELAQYQTLARVAAKHSTSIYVVALGVRKRG